MCLGFPPTRHAGNAPLRRPEACLRRLPLACGRLFHFGVCVTERRLETAQKRNGLLLARILAENQERAPSDATPAWARPRGRRVAWPNPIPTMPHRERETSRGLRSQSPARRMGGPFSEFSTFSRVFNNAQKFSTFARWVSPPHPPSTLTVLPGLTCQVWGLVYFCLVWFGMIA